MTTRDRVRRANFVWDMGTSGGMGNRVKENSLHDDASHGKSKMSDQSWERPELAIPWILRTIETPPDDVTKS